MRLVAASTSLVAVAVPLVSASRKGCGSDLDCSLNGVCGSDGACACDTPWSGETCGVLEWEDAAPGGIYGYSPNVTSWGGNVIEGDDGLFHLYVAEIDGGLSGWQHRSACIHATSATIDGRFERKDVVLGAQCHNPALLRDPESGEYLLFHIGSGGLSPSSSFMHHSSSPNGPWEPAPSSPGSCNNPAPEFHRNGTLFAVCGSTISSAPSWRGPWTSKRSMGKVPGGWEDPRLWFDSRGNFHVLYHVWTSKAWPTIRYSGHAFSRDGYHWTFSDVEPYLGTAHFTDGTSQTFATIERPQLIFADAKRTMPIAVVNGVSPQPAGPECDSCMHGSCSSCKQTPGRDWDYTVFRPLKGFAASRFGPGRAVV